MKLNILTWSQEETYAVILLIKETALKKQDIEKYYIQPLSKLGIQPKDVLVVGLPYQGKKAPVSLINQALTTVMLLAYEAKTKFIYCTDGPYFKKLTKETSVMPHLGYLKDCKFDQDCTAKIVLGVNHTTFFHAPGNQKLLTDSLNHLLMFAQGKTQIYSEDVIRSGSYPCTVNDIDKTLNDLLQYPQLTCDIETFSLEHYKAGIGTIGFAWSNGEGVAFPVDYTASAEFSAQVRSRLKTFFERYTGKLIFHGGKFDIKILTYELWMNDLRDMAGAQEGIQALCRDFDDTRLIAYVCLNSVTRPSLGLKDLAHALLGNYAEDDIIDITKIPLPRLLNYNLKDCIATYHLYDKYQPQMLAEQQEYVYIETLHDAVPFITYAELVGMYIDVDKLATVKEQLQQLIDNNLQIIFSYKEIQQVEDILTKRDYDKDYESRRNKAKNSDNIKRKVYDDFPVTEFNPNSGRHLRVLLFECLKLPVLDRTPTGMPSVGTKILDKLNKLKPLPLLKALIEYGQINKILSTFIPALEKNVDGRVYGNFNLAVVLSNRLSSSDPNLTNLPNGSTYGKIIKSCFIALKDFLFVGSDFNGLEAMIGALLTKDPNKLKVYLEGYDSHCLNAYGYFKKQMPDIVDTVESINSIKDKYPLQRHNSKPATFALQYQGTENTLVNTLGFTPEEAYQIMEGYKDLYKASIQWTEQQLQQVTKTGYGVGAFGLRIRAPRLSQTILNVKGTPTEAAAEARTIGNAIGGQSYCALNTRAFIDFMRKVWNSPYKLDILPCCLIHDAIYLYIKNDIKVIRWVNEELIKSMQWQELPEIQHDQIKLSSELDIFYRNWNEPITLPNNVDTQQIKTILQTGKQKYDD